MIRVGAFFAWRAGDWGLRLEVRLVAYVLL